MKNIEEWIKFQKQKQLDNISRTNKKLKCKKNLYKSTYKGFAFNKNKEYDVIEEDKNIVYLLDNTGREFNFTKVDGNNQYKLSDYFEI